jgi:AcrR family transcriptional regulator
MPRDGRSRKRLATRQGISVAATRLFLERGFERVTVEEIAAAAGVGRMTVFNHFPRKEDMFFDRDEESREIVRDALRRRDLGITPIEALRRLAHQLAAERSRLTEMLTRGVCRATPRFFATASADVTTLLATRPAPASFSLANT